MQIEWSIRHLDSLTTQVKNTKKEVPTYKEVTRFLLTIHSRLKDPQIVLLYFGKWTQVHWLYSFLPLTKNDEAISSFWRDCMLNKIDIKVVRIVINIRMDCLNMLRILMMSALSYQTLVKDTNHCMLNDNTVCDFIMTSVHIFVE